VGRERRGGAQEQELDVSEPFEAPAPGDPRSSGPRPRARAKDLVWGALSIVVVAVTVWQLGRLVYLAATDPDIAPSGGMLGLAFVITVVWLLTIFWVSVGAWRRTVWGCPFEHTEDAPRLRRCPRHGLLPAPGTPATERAEVGDRRPPGAGSDPSSSRDGEP
jgi:hypothetical protein